MRVADEFKLKAVHGSKGSIFEVLKASTKLGLTSFGGPIAHLGYFRNEYIQKRKWIDDKSYADLVALCQFLPGPASSQVGIGIGMMRAGLLGAVVAWIGFTLPSAVAMILFAYLFKGFDVGNAGWIHGLRIVAVAIVAQAVWGMGKNLASGKNKATIAIVAAVASLLWRSALTQILIILFAGITGLLLFRIQNSSDEKVVIVPVGKKLALISLSVFFGLLAVLPFMRKALPFEGLALFDSFYRVGSLVFGGGHVVLPLLENEVVSAGWITQGEFLAGFGAAQAVPGPLFTFAAYLGAIISGWSGAIITTLAVFFPSFLLVVGVLPFWDVLRRQHKLQGALVGINAAVVGILLAALYNPVWTNTVKTPLDFSMVLAAFGMLVFWKLPPWTVVVFSALTGAALSMIA